MSPVKAVVLIAVVLFGRPAAECVAQADSKRQSLPDGATVRLEWSSPSARRSVGSDAQLRMPIGMAPREVPESSDSRVTSLQAQTPRNSSGLLVLGGVIGGAVGLIGGGFIGAMLESGSCQGEELCGLGGFVLGGTLGEAVLLPLGVHLANDRRGNFAAASLISTGVAVAGIVVAIGMDQGAVLLAVPVAQIITSISVERRGRKTK